MSLLTHVVDWLVPFICGGVATVLGLMWRWGKAMVNGLRELLLCQLEDLRREMVIEHDGVADEDLKSRSQRLYDSYHSLGGNGHGTSLNNDIQSAPIAPRQSQGRGLRARFRHGANDFHGMSDCRSCSPPLTTRINQDQSPAMCGAFP